MKLISLSLIISFAFTQNKLAPFSNLVGSTWKIEAKFENGEEFKQEVSFSWDLDSTIVLTRTKGIVNRLTNEYGERNHGVRAWDKKQKRVRFWEFDVQGGITEGSVEFVDKSMFYTYKYGKSEIKESWFYIDANSYNFLIEEVHDGNVLRQYLKAEAKRN